MKFTIAALFIFIFNFVTAENFLPKDAKISGILKDSNSNESVPYASIGLYNAKDSSLVSGLMSAPDGSFTFDKVAYGQFYLSITFVGYKKMTVKNIILLPNKKAALLGTIKMAASAINLAAVEITGNPPAVSYKIDKKVINVAQNLTSAGGSLADVLRNAPSIQSDAEGNITVRGNSNFTVLIDGKPSPLGGNEALQQMPASLVQNVEIITNPSAKFEAEGTAGILNIITRKNKVQGMGGVVNVSAGTGDKYTANLNLNYKISRFNITVSGDIKDDQHTYSLNGINIDTLGALSLKRQVYSGDGTIHRYNKTLKAAVEYSINKNSSLSLTAIMGTRAFPRPIGSTYHDFYTNSFPQDVYYLNYNNSKFTRDFKSVNLDYLLKLRKKGEQISASFYLNGGPSNNSNTIQADTTDAEGNLSNKKELFQQLWQKNILSDMRTMVDYTLPLGSKGKFEAGYQGKYSTSKGKDQLFNYNGNSWNEDISQQDRINFYDQIQAGYLSILNSTSLFDYQIGLRTEYENREIDQQSMNQNYKINRIDLFPSVHLIRELPYKFQIQANYSRRVNRPLQPFLNPFIAQLDPTTIRQGNPDLKPEFANLWELNLEKKLTDASFISIEGYVRQTFDLIQMINRLNASNQMITMTAANIDHDQATGAEFMLYLEPFKWFSLNSSYNVYHYQMFGTSNNITGTNTWNLHVSPSFNFGKNTSMQLNYIYTAPSITAQGYRTGFNSSALAIRQNVLKNKGSLTFQILNLFGPTEVTTVTQTADLYKSSNLRLESQVFMLTFNYRINNYGARQKAKKQDNTPKENETEIDVQGF